MPQVVPDDTFHYAELVELLIVFVSSGLNGNR